ncbi:MAG: hypothetical protein ACKO6N_08450 [Myxococcota bacterium]
MSELRTQPQRLQPPVPSLSRVLLICPRCRHVTAEGQLHQAPLYTPGGMLATLGMDFSLEGQLCCRFQNCHARYPVLQGIPVLFRRPEALDLELSPPFDPLSLGGAQTLARARLEGLLNGQLAEGSALARLYSRLGRYALAGFSDRVQVEWLEELPALPHAVEVMGWLKELGEAQLCEARPRLVLGAALGREAWECSGATVLLDAHLPSLWLGKHLWERGELVLPMNQAGRRWSWAEIRIEPPTQAQAVWICADVQDPPFEAGAFGSVVGLNLLDSVADPMLAVGQADALTAPEGMLTLTSPFAWRAALTPREKWLEPELGPDNAETVLRRWVEHELAGKRRLLAQRSFRWGLRSAPREWVYYHSEGWTWT